MMTKEQMLAYYCPHERDETLGEGEYYCRDSADRVQRVRITNVMPYSRGGDSFNIYGCAYANNGKHFRGDYGNEPFDGVAFSQLYDNAQDCRDITHCGVDFWEELRK